jgi:AcrR family transcriptional regulator
MGRWAPDASGRLVVAALDLYRERGFDQTTVAEIAERAGLTERTFFRHFTDKREVLFAGAETLLDEILAGVANAPTAASAFDAVAAGLDVAATALGDRRDFAVLRHAVIAANPALHERELSKLASWATSIAATLVARGVPAATATLASEAGMAVFRVAFDRWVKETTSATLPDLMREAMNELRAVAATP